MMRHWFRSLTFVVTLLLFPPLHAFDAAAAIQLAEYIGADYINAVQDGQVVSDSEYEEMAEFADLLVEGLPTLPAAPGQEGLLEQAGALQQAVSAREDAARIKQLTQSLRSQLIALYGIAALPGQAPDPDRARYLYRQLCAGCHGPSGAGDGETGAHLDPLPTDFTERERYDGRSLAGLFTTLSQGVEGTGMAAFDPLLSEADRWALTFHVGRLAVDEALVEQGRRALADPALSARLDLKTVLARAPEDLLAEGGPDAYAAMAALRSNPSVLFSSNRFIDLSRQRLQTVLDATRRQDAAAARQAALSAYLDGFEMIEQQVAAVDRTLLNRAERAFMQVRQKVDRQAPRAEVEAAVGDALALLDQAGQALGGDALGPRAAATASFVILFREGLEALLVVAALLTFVRRAQVPRGTALIHAGWLLALVAGLGTWFLASTLLEVSGSTREVTEGVAALLAAAILFYMGFWMHGNASSRRWLHYLRDQVDAAVGRGTLWALVLVSFISVYREMFETILFYQALWSQVAEGARMAVLYGLLGAMAALALVCLLVFRLGMRLPYALFFRVASVVMLLLAFVLLGNGIKALQEAGWIGITLVPAPSLPLLGLHATLQGYLAQGLLVLTGLMWFRLQRRRAD